jgi:hypothetical protein
VEESVIASGKVAGLSARSVITSVEVAVLVPPAAAVDRDPGGA